MTHKVFDIQMPQEQERIPFKFLSGDENWEDYGGKFISERHHNGDWPYWFVIEAMNWWDATGDEDQPQYHVQLSAVSPEAAGEDNVVAALGSWGIYDDVADPEFLVDVLSCYGTQAILWADSSDDLDALIDEAHTQATAASTLFGFYLDAPQNRLGATGWDLIAGDIFGGAFRAHTGLDK